MYLFLRCQFFNAIWENLKSDLMNIDSSLLSICDEKLLDLLLYGNGKFDTKTSQNILVSTLKFMNDSHRFDNLLF